MILQSLHQLYERLPGIDPPGFAPIGLSWSIILTESGELIGLNPLRQKATRGNKLIPCPVSAPSVGKRTSNDKPGFLVDKTDYVFGCAPRSLSNARVVTKLRNRFKLFREAHLAARAQIQHPDFDAVCVFLENWNPDDPEAFDIVATAGETKPEEIFGSNLAFQISGQTGFVHQLPEVASYWTEKVASAQNSAEAVCLLTGEKGPVALVHPAIKHVVDEPGKPAEKGIVVFQAQKNAFSSYGKDGLQGLNAPVSINAALAYGTALNFLLKNRRFRIGDTSTVFWTEQPSAAEELLPWMMSGGAKGEDAETRNRVQAILTKICLGTLGLDELGTTDTDYHILGLAPNASRLSVRFWHTGTLGELVNNLRKHFDDLSLVREWDESNSKNPEPLAPTARRLLLETAPMKEGKRDESKISPLLGGELMRAILLGTRYPESLVNGIMRRIRVVEKKPRGEGSLDSVSYLRASILKAWLIRNHRAWLDHHHITMNPALDSDNPHPAYQLGRLFAVYEQIQRAAHQFKLERTIRETMFSAASATPQAVFGRLDRLNKHHLPKLKPGSKRHFDDLLEEIHQKIRGPEFYPASLNLKEQSLFCIGYYHQRHELRWKPDASPGS